MKKHGNFTVDKATRFPIGGKVIFMDKIFKIISEDNKECLIDGDSYGRMIVSKDKLQQLYIDCEGKRYYVDFKEYSRLWK